MRVKMVMMVLGLCLSASAFAHPKGADYQRGYYDQDQVEKRQKAAEQGALRQPLNEEQMVRVLGVVDNGETELARMLLQKSDNEQIKDFARRTRDDHQRFDDQNVDLINQHDLKGENSEASRMLMREHDRAKMDLARLDGEALDQRYLAAQIRMHEMALQIVEAARTSANLDQALLAHLDEVAPTLEEHLEMARELQTAEPPQVISG